MTSSIPVTPPSYKKLIAQQISLEMTRNGHAAAGEQYVMGAIDAYLKRSEAEPIGMAAYVFHSLREIEEVTEMKLEDIIKWGDSNS